MTKVYFATATQEFAFDRICSNCEESWTTTGIASSGSHMEQSSEQAATTAGYVLTDEIKDWRDNRDHLCPHCSHFSTDAMETHFRKGYADRILKNYKRASWCDFLLFLGAGWIPLVLFIFTNLNPWTAEKPIRSIIFLVLFLFFGSLSLTGLVIFLWARISFDSVARRLETLSQEELRCLVVECYKDNKNSLHIEIDADRGGLFNAWLKNPLLYKAGTEAEAKLVSE